MITHLKAEKIVVTTQEKEELFSEFPIINSIKNETIRESLLCTWARCWRMSEYKHIAEMPFFNETDDGLSLAEHTRAVAAMAVCMAGAYKEEYELPIEYDNLIAGALILDVDKPLCFRYDTEGNRQLTEFGKLMPPGCGATAIAIEAGLPIEVASVADCHSYISRVHAGTPEGIMLDYADKAVNRALIIKNGGIVPNKTGYGG